MDTIELRQRFLQEYVTNRYKYHEVDAKRVRESDYLVKRFIMHKKQGANAAFYHLKDTMAWKKSFGIHDFNVLHIPKEIYELGPMFDYLPDKSGCRPIYIRIKCIVKIDLIADKMKLAFAHLMDKIDNEVRKPNGWSLVFDATDAGLENANFDLMYFALDAIGKHFPLQPKYVIVYGIPWMLRPIVKMGMAMIPAEAQEKLHFVEDFEVLKSIIAEENLPDFMGGSATKDYRTAPPGAKSIFELGKELYKLTDAEVKLMMEPMTHLFDEGKKYATNNNDGNNNDGGGAKEYIIEEFD